MNILFMDWGCFGKDGTIKAMEELGHTVYKFEHEDYKLRQSATFLDAFYEFVEKYHIDFCFSYNYFPVLAIGCHEKNLKYISFLYDSPYVMLYSFTLMYPTNYVFLFDQAEYLKLRQGGLTNIYYMVLPADTEQIEKLLKQPFDQERVTADISFMGQLYNEEHNFLDRVTAAGDEYLNGYLRGIMESQKKISGYNFIEEMLTPDILKRMQDAYPFVPDQTSVESPTYTYAKYFIDRKITSEERIHILTEIGKRFPQQCKLFTWNQNTTIEGVKNMGIAEYFHEMPLVFRHSKINLNISLRSIYTGIPLRCMDIMANRGFLLSNYQSDLAEAFIPGEEYVYYEDTEDLMDKIDYYLTHEKERLEITENGYQKVVKLHNYKDCFTEIFRICEIQP
jgi:spore maturation protein CgeB